MIVMAIKMSMVLGLKCRNVTLTKEKKFKLIMEEGNEAWLLNALLELYIPLV